MPNLVHTCRGTGVVWGGTGAVSMQPTFASAHACFIPQPTQAPWICKLSKRLACTT